MTKRKTGKSKFLPRGPARRSSVVKEGPSPTERRVFSDLGRDTEGGVNGKSSYYESLADLELTSPLAARLPPGPKGGQ